MEQDKRSIIWELLHFRLLLVISIVTNMIDFFFFESLIASGKVAPFLDAYPGVTGQPLANYKVENTL